MDHSSYLAPAPDGGLWWGPLTEGRLLRRYKRFLADVELATGEIITAHTANTGRMTGCSEPGRRVWLSPHEGAGRKYPYTLEMIEMPTSMVGVNTMVPNRLVAAAAQAGVITDLDAPLTKVEREVKTGQSRLDLRLTDKNGQVIMVEIKNCTLAEDNIAFFPDAVTARGSKHLDELAELAGEGRRAVVFILVQRTDAACFSPADHIDPEWGRRLRAAKARGVEIWAWQADLRLDGISLARKLPVVF
ncbi:DNA/RNA nuclease SfsA [Deltaproteobacteria bacterium Smac51]|nr:DNA/RNA nuclease SfsA [Deltaproteobacteria bacterium Smac51]